MYRLSLLLLLIYGGIFVFTVKYICFSFLKRCRSLPLVTIYSFYEITISDFDSCFNIFCVNTLEGTYQDGEKEYQEGRNETIEIIRRFHLLLGKVVTGVDNYSSTDIC